MDYSWVVILVGALATLGGAAVAGHFSLKGQRTVAQAQQVIEDQKTKVDKFSAEGEAYGRAQRINKEIADALQAELTRLQATIDDLRRDLARKEEREDQLEHQVDQLQIQVSNMRLILKQHGIDYDAEVNGHPNTTH